VGYDKQLNPETRFRLTGSMYAKAKSSSNTLYSGDRAGSRYYDVMENTTSTESAQAWSGAIQPGFKSEVHAVVINPSSSIADSSYSETSSVRRDGRSLSLPLAPGARTSAKLSTGSSATRCTSVDATTPHKASSPASPAT